MGILLTMRWNTSSKVSLKKTFLIQIVIIQTTKVKLETIWNHCSRVIQTLLLQLITDFQPMQMPMNGLRFHSLRLLVSLSNARVMKHFKSKWRLILMITLWKMLNTIQNGKQSKSHITNGHASVINQMMNCNSILNLLKPQLSIKDMIPVLTIKNTVCLMESSVPTISLILLLLYTRTATWWNILMERWQLPHATNLVSNWESKLLIQLIQWILIRMPKQLKHQQWLLRLHLQQPKVEFLMF